ncbi:MAG TPA: NAD-dependent epimerase/dehydratase family protein [Bryobacteraceae bacterium]|nr:NAD-dependent epimerase/dehydratase family protein [Bryobacteraceae bacterium]
MSGHVLITGGAGFIGTNLAHRLLSQGETVLIYDNLSRAGVDQNLEWLRALHGARLLVDVADIRDRYALGAVLKNARQVYHLAAQVAVTKSIEDPGADFEINARGTLNLLEAIRQIPDPPSVVFTSTNKVYGELADVALQRTGRRYEPANRTLRTTGIGEGRTLSFHSPYGCSKGTADQYVLDYARVYGIRAAVFRMSCIYGPHQFGTEDQGWVAHFMLRALDRETLTIYGDGMQVRDILFVEDLVDAFLLAQKNMDRISGRAFNVGGGPANTVSLLELLETIGEFNGAPPRVHFEHWRTADQKYYVSDTRAFGAATAWRPRTGVREGTRKLWDWLIESRGMSVTRALTSRLAS